MKIKLTLQEKEVLRPVTLPAETKEFDLSTWDGFCAYNATMLEARSDERRVLIEQVQEEELVKT